MIVFAGFTCNTGAKILLLCFLTNAKNTLYNFIFKKDLIYENTNRSFSKIHQEFAATYKEFLNRSRNWLLEWDHDVCIIRPALLAVF